MSTSERRIPTRTALKVVPWAALVAPNSSAANVRVWVMVVPR
jgi:hypothetical protein